MKSKIKLSIIVPVYNTEKYLEQCLNSIVNQSLKEIEIIVINDCSPDNSLKIIKRYMERDNRIILINKTKNEGVSEARNSAIKIARGEYCLNIDSDDWIEPNYFYDMYTKAKCSNFDILVSDINIVYENKIEILKDLMIENSKYVTGLEYLNIFFLNNLYGFTWNKLIRTELYYKNQIFYNKNRKFIEDVELLGEMCIYCEKIGKLNKAYYNYRQGENNSSTKRNFKNLSDLYDGLKKLNNIYLENGLLELADRVKKVKIILVLVWLFKNECDKTEIRYEQFIIKFLTELKNEKYIFSSLKKDKYFSIKRIIFYDLVKLILSLNFNLVLKLLK